MEIVFLGTSCAKPTKERNHSAIFISHGADGLLFDCGEGTQRQLTVAGIRPTKITKVLISHWHGDHVFGLPGLISTLGLSEYKEILKIYGPEGTKEYMGNLLKSFSFDQRIGLEVHEIKKGEFYKGKGYHLEAYPVDHLCPTLGYRFVEEDRLRIDLKAAKKIGIPEGPLLGKLQQGESVMFKGKKIAAKEVTYEVHGKVISYIPDSVPSKYSLNIAENADVLICDATYGSEMEEQAEQYKHMTAKQAATIASKANVKQLILSHFSTRYKNVKVLEEEAKDIFPNTKAAYDFMKVNL